MITLSRKELLYWRKLFKASQQGRKIKKQLYGTLRKPSLSFSTLIHLLIHKISYIKMDRLDINKWEVSSFKQEGNTMYATANVLLNSSTDTITLTIDLPKDMVDWMDDYE